MPLHVVGRNLPRVADPLGLQRAMADPLSIAGGAVGFVSLGLTACKSIISFYETYKDQDEETNGLVRKSEELRIVLEALKGHLPQLEHSHPELVKSITTSIDFFVKSLDSLDPAVAKCRKSKDSGDVIERLRTSLSRAAYPFRRDTILNLNRRVNDCRDSLSFALTTLGLYVAPRLLRAGSTELTGEQIQEPIRFHGDFCTNKKCTGISGKASGSWGLDYFKSPTAGPSPHQVKSDHHRPAAIGNLR